MRRLLGTAILFGAVGFVAMEASLALLDGGYAGTIGEATLAFVAFVLASLLCAVALRHVLRWARGWRYLVVVPAYLTAFWLATTFFWAVITLTVAGRWAYADEVRMAFLGNASFLLEDLVRAFFVTLPLGILAVVALAKAYRADLRGGDRNAPEVRAGAR